MSLLAELFEGLETSTGEIDTLKTQRIRAASPAPRFHHSHNVAATTSSAGPEDEHYGKSAVSSLLVLVDPHISEAPQPALQSGCHGGEPQHLIHTAATATLEWIAARDHYVSHLMSCCACYAPNGRYCAAGAELRQQFEQTPWEQQPCPKALPSPFLAGLIKRPLIQSSGG